MPAGWEGLSANACEGGSQPGSRDTTIGDEKEALATRSAPAAVLKQGLPFGLR